MPTDYILFNHGVSVRDTHPKPTYADTLFDLIKNQYQLSPTRTLKKIALYWGDVNDANEQKLLAAYRSSPYWNKMWFRSARETIILQCIGDAALYFSRYTGAKVADVLAEQTLAGLQGFNPEEDRLHLVTHSMGTIILFDMLFSSRWDPECAPGHASVETIRDLFFGIGTDATAGIHLGSISTLGSPIGFFSLLDVNQNVEPAVDAQGNPLSTHDITPGLTKLLMSLYKELGMKLPWYNFMHPGDPIAYPLAQLLPELVDPTHQYIDTSDTLIAPTRLLDRLLGLFSQSSFTIINGLQAHNEYFESRDVAQKVSEAIEKASRPLAASEMLHQP